MNGNDAGRFDLYELARITHSAVFSDVCDRLGYRQQTLPPRITRMTGTGVLIGYARTFLTVPVDAPPDRHYGGEIDFIDSLRPADVAVGDASGRPAAAWGELFSNAARGRGARGAVIDGLIRDVERIEHVGFPIHAVGTRPTDSLGRVSLQSVDLTLDIDGVRVAPGDLVVADRDGVTIVPAEIVDEAIPLAVEKATTENAALDLLREGGLLADVWERYRVL